MKMKIKKHNIDHQNYEGEEILITTANSLDHIIHNHYQTITTEQATTQEWTANQDIFTLILELNPDLDTTNQIIEGTTIFMPNPPAKSADTRIKLWE